MKIQKMGFWIFAFLLHQAGACSENCEAEFWQTLPWEYNGQIFGPGVLVGGCLSDLGSGNVAQNSITVDSNNLHQQILGFGAALTESSAYLISQHPKKQEILDLLFKNKSSGGVDISMIRIPVSMMSDFVMQCPYTYVKEGDIELNSFNITKDKDFFIPLLKDILEIKPELKIMAAPWSAPGWMKKQNTLFGSDFDENYIDVYSKYLLKYLEAYKSEGIEISYLLPQNEPLHSANGYPTMTMTSQIQANLIKNLGEKIANSVVNTKIVIYGHNWDNLDFARQILLDPQTTPYVEGVAFHCYAGDHSAPAQLAAQFPNVKIMFEECSGYDKSATETDWAPGVLTWNQQNLFIGQPKDAKSTSVLLWNIALDENHGPNIVTVKYDGNCPSDMACGCTLCRGLLTLTDTDYRTNVDLWAVGHSSSFVPPMSTRIETTSIGNIVLATAYKRPDGKLVVVAQTIYWSGDQQHDASFVIDGKHYKIINVAKEAAYTMLIA